MGCPLYSYSNWALHAFFSISVSEIPQMNVAFDVVHITENIKLEEDEIVTSFGMKSLYNGVSVINGLEFLHPLLIFHAVPEERYPTTPLDINYTNKLTAQRANVSKRRLTINTSTTLWFYFLNINDNGKISIFRTNKQEFHT